MRAQATEPARHDLDPLIAKHAQANGVPESLLRRVIERESRYDAHVIGKGGTYGLMQIKPATARSMGYRGDPLGLLDPDTNLTFAVRYLAGAYQAADGNADQAIWYYSRGYYDVAKRKRLEAVANPGVRRLSTTPARLSATPAAAVQAEVPKPSEAK